MALGQQPGRTFIGSNRGIPDTAVSEHSIGTWNPEL